MQIPGAYLDPPPLRPPPTSKPNMPTVQPRQTKKQPACFRDVLPEPPIPAPRLPIVYLMVTNPLTTALNAFGLFQHYLFHPSHDPDSAVDPSDLSNLSTRTPPPPSPESNEANHGSPWPFPNMLVWRLMQWMNTGSRSKSEGEVN